MDSKKFFSVIGLVLLFVAGGLIGVLTAPRPEVKVEEEQIQSTWRYENQPYAQNADGSLTYHHGYTQRANFDPINGLPYSVGKDGAVIFYHGK